MKKIQTLIFALVALACALPAVAQSGQVYNVADTPPSSSGGNGEPMKQQAARRQHTKFLGYELGGNAKALEKALRAKGFTDGDGFNESGNTIFLKGTLWGQMSNVSIDATGGRANSVTVSNMASGVATAMQRFKTYKEKMVADYGKGYVPDEGAYEIPLTYGKITCDYGAFDYGEYELSLNITDYEKPLDKVEYNIDVAGIGCELNDFNNWNTVKEILNKYEYPYTQISSTEYSGQLKVGTFVSNLSIKRANAQTTRLSIVSITTPNSMSSVQEHLGWAGYKLSSTNPDGGKTYKKGTQTAVVTQSQGFVIINFTNTPVARKTTAKRKTAGRK